MYRDLRDNNKVFSGLAAAAPANAGVSWNNRAEQVPVEMVSGNYFQTLGVQPAAGRLLLPDDETTDKANPVVVLSFDYWTSRLAQAAVIGKTLLINGYPFTIVGVAAPGFHTMVWGRHPDLYVPITMQTVIEPEWTYLNDHGSYWLTLVGRLHPGETPQQALAGCKPPLGLVAHQRIPIGARSIGQVTQCLYLPDTFEFGLRCKRVLSLSRQSSYAIGHHDGYGGAGHGYGHRQCC